VQVGEAQRSAQPAPERGHPFVRVPWRHLVHEVLDEILPGPTASDPVNQVIATEELASLVTCLSGVLSELESRVLSLYLDGYSYEVIAERLDCDTKTVDNALQRVKRKVGTHLASREVRQ